MQGSTNKLLPVHMFNIARVHCLSLILVTPQYSRFNWELSARKRREWDSRLYQKFRDRVLCCLAFTLEVLVPIVSECCCVTLRRMQSKGMQRE